jgi:hypothetical protein
MRLALFVGQQHQCDQAWGFAQLYRSPNLLGLISRNGIVVTPRPSRAWRVKPCTSTPRSAASSTAHRRAAADGMDPSNPTTIISLLLRLAMRAPVLPPASVPAARHL